jgi:hypothetical protein
VAGAAGAVAAAAQPVVSRTAVTAAPHLQRARPPVPAPHHTTEPVLGCKAVAVVSMDVLPGQRSSRGTGTVRVTVPRVAPGHNGRFQLRGCRRGSPYESVRTPSNSGRLNAPSDPGRAAALRASAVDLRFCCLRRDSAGSTEDSDPGRGQGKAETVGRAPDPTRFFARLHKRLDRPLRCATTPAPSLDVVCNRVTQTWLWYGLQRADASKSAGSEPCGDRTHNPRIEKGTS